MPCLEACLAAPVDVVAVYTQPDRPAGRGRKLAASPGQAARARGRHCSRAAGNTEGRRRAASGSPRYAPDLLVVVAYGLILPRRVLAIPRLGCWNVHASLLPRWRGAAPIQRAILAGDTRNRRRSHADGSRPRHRTDPDRATHADRRRRNRRLAARSARRARRRCARRRPRAHRARRNIAAACASRRRRHLRAQDRQEPKRGSTGTSPRSRSSARCARSIRGRSRKPN